MTDNYMHRLQEPGPLPRRQPPLRALRIQLRECSECRRHPRRRLCRKVDHAEGLALRRRLKFFVERQEPEGRVRLHQLYLIRAALFDASLERSEPLGVRDEGDAEVLRDRSDDVVPRDGARVDEVAERLGGVAHLGERLCALVARNPGDVLSQTHEDAEHM